MSACPKYLECLETAIDWLTILKLWIVKDSDDNYYLNLCYNDCTDCDTMDFGVDCLGDMDLLEVMKAITTEDECGLPAIHMTGNICAACE